jgi:hypothetical protein
VSNNIATGRRDFIAHIGLARLDRWTRIKGNFYETGLEAGFSAEARKCWKDDELNE